MSQTKAAPSADWWVGPNLRLQAVGYAQDVFEGHAVEARQTEGAFTWTIGTVAVVLSTAGRLDKEERELAEWIAKDPSVLGGLKNDPSVLDLRVR